jgi:hypothetical protein
VATDPSTAHNRSRLAVLAAVTAASLLAVAAASARPSASGNPTTLAHFAQLVDDYRSVPGARVVEYGLFWLHYNGGTSVDYRWGGSKPAGFKAAKAVIDYQLDDGKIVAYYATVTARDVPRLRILLASGNVFTSTTTCWNRAGSESSPFGTGERVLVSDSNGQFDAIKHKGRNMIVKFRYIWTEGTRATETMTLLPGNPPAIRSKIVGKGDENFTISYSLRPLKRAPKLPVKTRSPRPPQPSPFCKGR